ncbi:histidine phosphatase family protein [Streptomyces sp. NPDC056121]|uniref:histidine phosphatase family protein n=1 Tax=Streptomyces sp. NPDC056121 TaxID=3345718 RepID=UPI0035D6AAB7
MALPTARGAHSCELITSSPIPRRRSIVSGVVGSWHHSQLTPAGVLAAVSIAQALRARIPDGAAVDLLSSDLQRTSRTAGEVAEVFGVKPILDSRPREKSYGEAGGQPQEHLDRHFVPPPTVGERMDTPRAWRTLKPKRHGR